jgi:acetyltransferase
LLQIRKDENLSEINAEILLENLGMQRVCEKRGFVIQLTDDCSVVKAAIAL